MLSTSANATVTSTKMNFGVGLKDGAKEGWDEGSNEGEADNEMEGKLDMDKDGS